MNLLYLVLAMAVVTYVPRMLPMVLLRHVSLPDYCKRFMQLLPYAALGALIFPGVLSSTGTGHTQAAVAGSVLAIILAWFETNLIIVVVGGIVGAWFVNLL